MKHYERKPEKFPLRDSYVERRILNGEKRRCAYPQNGIPKTTVKSAHIPSPLVAAFGLKDTVQK